MPEQPVQPDLTERPDLQGPQLGQVVAGVQTRLAEAGVPSPAADAHQLVAHALGVPRRDLARRIVLREQLDGGALAALSELVEARVQRVPLQHLTGVAGFRTIELLVGPGVFVPRAETELSAGLAIEAARAAVAAGVSQPLVVDLCTGSGAIALAVAAEVPQARVVAVELSPDAVAWARRNVEHVAAEHPDLPTRVEIRAGDAGDPQRVADLLGRADVVAANPPYIPPHAEPVEPEVRDHDPAVALYGGGPDGLEVPRAVVRVAQALLRAGGTFVMEHGSEQGAATRAMVDGEGWAAAATQADLTGRDRALLAVRSERTGSPG